ncbi:MAG: glycosyl hydrolase family 18 protein [Bacillota bacterium]
MLKRILIYILVVIIGISLIGCDSSIDLTTTTEVSTTTTGVSTTSTTTTEVPTTTTEETTRVYIVSFDVGEGSYVSSINVESGSTINLPESEREGYSFLGWTLIDDEEAEIIDNTFQPDSNITLYAKWRINQYTISFITNNESAIAPITQAYNTEVIPPEDPFKEGFIFMGWYLDSEFTRPYSFSTMPAENITLYAKWEAIDWSDVELYLSDLVPEELSDNINLPNVYNDYTITWISSNPEILSNEGIYKRPYQVTNITLSAIIQLEQHSITKIYNIEVAGYKTLSAPLTSSYIYRNYDLVTDSFFKTLDIINCAFITANSEGTLSGTSVLNNINTYIMPKARENGNWVIFSIAPDSDWSEIASSTSRINTFADNIVEMINTYGFDGVDIDWETPTSSEASRFTEMMSVIYTKVKANNPNHLVTAAIAGGMWQPPRYDLENSHQYLDYINMMTYGMVSNNGYYQNALNKSTSFDNPLNSVGKTLTSCSIEESIAIYNTYGIPNSKIIVGVAFYGIKQTRTFDQTSQTWSDWVNSGYVSFTSIVNNYLNNSSYDYYYDNQAGVPYIIKTDGTVFISYDNPVSISEKSTYIIENGLAGMMYWENGLDQTGLLLLAMETGLKQID